MKRLQLPTVTLCAVTSINVAATLVALRASMVKVAFAECLLFTDTPPGESIDGITVIEIGRLESAVAYSEFLLHRLVDYVTTPYCLIVQWDGFVVDAGAWKPAFLDYDYIGAPWPQFSDGHDVGNGGFSLRSLKLLRALHDPRFLVSHPEDVAICRINRDFLEREHGIRFASRQLAEEFAYERSLQRKTFGFHGVFNMIPLLGARRFEEIYRTVDDRGTIFHDFCLLLRQAMQAEEGGRLLRRLLSDRLRAAVPLPRGQAT